MSLPWKGDPNIAENSDPPTSHEDLGPKIIAMESSDPEIDLDDGAAEEVEFVLRRAAEALAHKARPLHAVGEGIACAYDEVMRNTAASVRRGVHALRNLAKEDPLRFIAVAAGAAFVAGFVLKAWKSSRA